jgi:uncharacterized protein GlcG (DUF336 family)
MIELTLAMAERIAKATLAKGAAVGAKLSVSVVDESGRLVLTMRSDGASFLTTESSRAKAVAACAYRQPTSKLSAAHATNPFWQSVPTMSRGEALPTGGAVPILKDGKVIGAVGCGGGTPQEDEDCAAAGVAAM